jgi:hypothetical protein
MNMAELEHWKTLLVALCGVLLWIAVSAAALLRYWLAGSHHGSRDSDDPLRTSGSGKRQ